MLKRTCVLVVDDDDDTCDVLDCFLRDLGIYPVTATSLDGALSALRVTRIDAAIVGQRLADASAGMLLARMRRMGHDVPAIALASPRRGGDIAPRAEEFVAELALPLEPHAVEDAVRRALDAPRARRSTVRAVARLAECRGEPCPETTRPSRVDRRRASQARG